MKLAKVCGTFFKPLYNVVINFSGGIGEAVCAAVAETGSIRVNRIAVPRVPQSGPPNALLDMFGISASCIAKGVKAMLA